MIGGNGGMNNGKITIGIAADTINTQTQFQRPVFQTRSLAIIPND